jgi:aryl-alcohol dehydrogenase
MNITAVVIREKAGPFSIEQLQLDNPKDDKVLIRIVGAGVCYTDLVCRDHYYPVPLPCVFGREGSGVVEQVGARVKP